MKIKPLLLVSTIGAMLTLSELILKFFNSNLCNTKGCLVVAQSLRISDSYIVALGFFAFFSILILGLLKNRLSEFLIDGILTIALSTEGLFVGYQLFRIEQLCLFCLSVFTLFVLLALIRILQSRYFLLSGFVSFFAILSMLYILKPESSTHRLVFNKPLTLIYKDGCPHCRRVAHFVQKSGINIQLKDVNLCIPFLKQLDINAVPILIAKNGEKREIIVGDRPIINYLSKKVQKEKTLPVKDCFNEWLDKDSNKKLCTIKSRDCN
jgi:uncharacterized membrane protein/glutaredoxin